MEIPGPTPGTGIQEICHRTWGPTSLTRILRESNTSGLGWLFTNSEGLLILAHIIKDANSKVSDGQALRHGKHLSISWSPMSYYVEKA